MRWRPLLALGVVALLFARPAVAAPSRAELIDPVGDANGVNTQGERGLGSLDVATAPVSIGDADLERLLLAHRPRGGGFTVSFVLATGPAEGYSYRLLADVSGGCELFVNAALGAPATITANCGDDQQRVELDRPVVVGRTLVVIVPGDRVPSSLPPSARLGYTYWRAATPARLDADTASGDLGFSVFA